MCCNMGFTKAYYSYKYNIINTEVILRGGRFLVIYWLRCIQLKQKHETEYHNQLLPQQHNCIRQYQHGSDVKLKLHSRQAMSSKMVNKLLAKSNKSAWGLKVEYCPVAFDLHDKRSRTYYGNRTWKN